MTKTEATVTMTTEEYMKLVGEPKEQEQKVVAPKVVKRLCTSKKILITVWSITALLLVVTLYAFLFTDKDVTAIVTLAGIMTTASAADTAFYSWKAKAENKIKLTKEMVESMAEKYGIESVVSLASSLLND